MKIVFFGTPEYVLPVLDKIHKKYSRRGISPVSAVVTQPPRPVGREQILTFSPVDAWAFRKKVPILYEPIQVLKERPEADLGVLASYGAIIPKEVIEFFPHGILNIHPSLLPKWRGAAPVQAPIMAEEEETGVTIIKLDEKLDLGPIVSQFKERVLETDSVASLRARLFERGAEALVQLLEPYLKGKITPRVQNHSRATYASQIKKEEALIPTEYLEGALSGKTPKGVWKIGFMKDFTIPPSPSAVNRFVKAMDPWPGAWTYVKLKPGTDPKRLKILKTHLDEKKLILDMVQLEGKGPVSWKQFTEAYSGAKFS